ncbi:MAG: 50S ribosomal protein L33 [Pseudomonadota bacterium]|nr:MAG: 50S ribosomal protein L33 [Pseudomonadota bacterium]
MVRRGGSQSEGGPRGRRIRVALACALCGSRNYRTTRLHTESEILNLSKFCKHCNRHTRHIEGK